MRCVGGADAMCKALRCWLDDATHGHLLQDRVVTLAKYIRAEQVSLQQLPGDALLEGRFAWGPVPKFPPVPKDYKPVENVKPGLDSELDETPASEEKEEWRTAVSATGKIYYWNTVTREKIGRASCRERVCQYV